MVLTLYVGCSLLLFTVACGRREADRDSVDTVMVFSATPSSPQDSSHGPSKVLTATIGSYYARRITADSAARVIVDYLEIHQSFNANLDPELTNAIRREQKRRAHR